MQPAGNGPFAGALAPHNVNLPEYRADGADKPCRAPFIWDIFHLPQQLGIIGGGIVPLPGIAGGVHPRRTVQGIHAEARVIRYGGQAGGPVDAHRLEEGVFRKGTARFLDLQIGRADLILRDDLPAQRG